MDIKIPPDWILISEAQMQSLIDCCQYTMDGWWGGFFFIHRHSGERFAAKLDNGEFWCDPKSGDWK